MIKQDLIKKNNENNFDLFVLSDLFFPIIVWRKNPTIMFMKMADL